MHIHSYPSIYNFGHAAINDLLSADVIVEEKVDGSQFSFTKDEEGQLHFRSKGKHLEPGAPEKMFEAGVASITEIADLLRPGWTYRGEYLQKPKHNSLAYSRIPARHVILFDINTGDEQYLSREQKERESERIGLEIVPELYGGKIRDAEHFRGLLQTESCLGGALVEGVVIKPAGYDIFGKDKKCVMAKYVSDSFREVHAKEWKKGNPTKSDVVAVIGASLKTSARWEKAIQHLRDAGKLTGTVQDIGLIMREVPADILKEYETEIKEQLMKWAWPQIQRIAVAGLPEYYKQKLVDQQFEQSA